MTQGVVDRLEAIQIHDHHGKAPLTAFRLGNGLFESVREQQAVRQAGQRVVRGDVLQLRVGLLELLVVTTSLGLEVSVVHEEDRGDRQ